MAQRYYSSVAQRTTLAADVTNAATTLAVVAVTGFPASYPYTLIIDQDTLNEEVIEVTSRSGTTLTVVRGVDGTTAVAHTTGAVVNHGVSARDFSEPNTHVNDSTNDVHTQYAKKTLWSGKGVIVAASATNTPLALAAGTDTNVLIADSAQTAGVKWGTVAQSAVTNLTSDLALKADIVSETTTDYTLASNVLTMDLNNGNVGFIATAPTAAMTFNFTNAPTTNGKSITVTVFVTQGATGYGPTTFQIGGSAQTIKWAGGTAPTPTNGAGKIDVYSFTLIRRSSAWTVLGSGLANF